MTNHNARNHGFSSFKKVCFICFNESPLKKPFLLVTYSNFCLDFFGHVGKRFDKIIRLFSKFMSLNLGNKQLQHTYDPISQEVKVIRQLKLAI